MSSEAYFLDASVLMYAAGAAHPRREPSRAVLERAATRRLKLITDSEVLQEILYRYFAINRPRAAETVYATAVALCDEILPVTEGSTSRALELLLQHSGLSPRDAIHVATMEKHGLQRILTTDRDFDALENIERVDPADLVR